MFYYVEILKVLLKDMISLLEEKVLYITLKGSISTMHLEPLKGSRF